MKLETKHILGTESLSLEQVHQILDKARDYRAFFSQSKQSEELRGRVMVNAFFENSTRTRSSFEIAAKRLGAEVVNFSASASSVAKGESLFDTLQTLDAMQPDVFVIRHRSSGAASFASGCVQAGVINAGDGMHEHPTQALLDVLTLLDVMGSLQEKTIGIVGDLAHSRVFRSNYHLLRLLGARVLVSAPPTLCPRDIRSFDVELLPDAQSLVSRCDAVMTLRLQKERMQSGLIPSEAEYARRYGLLNARFASHPEVWVLHPGPVNYGVEIEYEIANGKQSLIRQQVTNGVFVRMACLSMVCASQSDEVPM